MHITDLNQIASDDYAHVYLSPHFDDAALSCGGAIARHSSRGARILVINLCTAAPDPSGTFSDLAQEFHRYWQLQPHEVVSVRLHEDQLAMERIGADTYSAGLLDAIYRLPDTYNTRPVLYGGRPDANDPMLADLQTLLTTLRTRLPDAMFYAPLAIGGHIDHAVAFEVVRALDLGSVAFYEDFPYVAKPQALQNRLAQLAADQFVPSILDIDATLARKISAIDAYASQLDEVFGSRNAMHAAVTGYAELLRPEDGTYGERVWLRVPRP